MSHRPDHRRIAVVTGASAGVGRAIVRELAEHGYDVGLLARGRAGLEAAAGEVRNHGGRALVLPTDVADRDAVFAARDRVESELGPIDVWVNCAFVGALAWSWETSPEDFRRMTDVTYYGQVHGTMAALETMRPRDHGAVVNVSSAMAHRSIPLQAAYCGAKHAVKGFTESVLTELKASGSSVRVGLVTLPGVNTTQFAWNLNQMPGHPQPVPPLVQPEVCARAVRFAAEHPRRNTWVGIPTVYTVLGNRLAPTFMDWYLARTGVDSQQIPQADGGAELPRWGSNLDVARDDDQDRGAHGPFDDSAWTRDPVSFVGRHRRALTGGAALAAGLAGVRLLGDTGALVVRVLGARQLGQAALAATPWGPDLVVPGALVDLTHAATAFALAGVDRSRARAGLIEGVVAVSYAAWALVDPRGQ